MRLRSRLLGRLLPAVVLLASLVIALPTVARADGELSISTSALAGGQVGTAYNQTATAAGGTGPYTWAISAGGLPAGLTLSTSTGVISGTPTAAGTTSVTLQASDTAAHTVTKTFSVTIAAAPVPLSISTAALADGTVSTAYSKTLAAAGGTSPYTWSLIAGALPAGITMNSAGVLSGTPSTIGSVAFTVQVTDAAAGTVTKTFALNIVAPLPTLAVSTTSLSGGTIGTAYSKTLAATGGTSPYTWSLISGSLPGGLALNTTTGIIAGTPTNAGNSTFTLQVADSASHVATKTLSINVSSTATPTPSPTVTPTPTPTPKPQPDWHNYDRYKVADYFYGMGLSKGDRVSAYINGLLCGSDTVERAGQWSIRIAGDARCAPMTGSLVAFTLNGKPANVSPVAVWTPRNGPLNTYGYTLTTRNTSYPHPGIEGKAFYSGSGLTSGAEVVVLINGVACNSTTVNSSGKWSTYIKSDASCTPYAGAEVGFTVGGVTAVATPAATWQSGGNTVHTLTVSTGPSTPADMLPYQAYGSGLTAGAQVNALRNGSVVANATVDVDGNWMLNIPAASATNGDVIAFTVNGALAAETVIFHPGGFVVPPGLTLTVTGGTVGTGTFLTTPNFGTGVVAQVVFNGGTPDQLEAATSGAGASGAWIQDSTGKYHLLIVGAPAFLKTAFSAAFLSGIAPLTAVVLTRA